MALCNFNQRIPTDREECLCGTGTWKATNSKVPQRAPVSCFSDTPKAGLGEECNCATLGDTESDKSGTVSTCHVRLPSHTESDSSGRVSTCNLRLLSQTVESDFSRCVPLSDQLADN